MKFDFRNKCVVLSGVTGGIGRALCRRLIEEYGCRVIGVARSPAKAARLKEELGFAAGSLEIRLMDADGENTRTLVRLFGGQGTLNVNSWSPDGTQLAFVSYGYKE